MTKPAALLACLLLALPLVPLAAQAALAEAPLKDIPLHVMEFHLWWNTPHGIEEKYRMWTKWTWLPDSNPDRSVGPSWRRELGSSAYPLIGPYNPANPGVMRWQLQCARAAGIDALHVQLFPRISTGLTFGREEDFARLLDIAGEEAMPVCIHDEVQFREGPSRTGPVMAQRLADVLLKYGAKPGYAKIDGRPVVSFQFWNLFLPYDELQTMMQTVNRRVPGGVHFMVNGAATPELLAIPEVSSVVATANSNFLQHGDKRAEELDWDGLEQRLADVRQARRQSGGRPFALWAYPGFDNASHGNPPGRWFPRGENLANLKRVVARYAEEKPDIVLLSSWNDWAENTALEPALDVDGFDGDPYQALRAVAAMRGREFTPPPLPPFASMDPWIVALHGGPDQTPPRLANAWVQPHSRALKVDAIDETSPVAALEVNRAPIASLACEAAAADAPAMLGKPGWSLAAERKWKLGRDAEASSATARWLVVSYWDGAAGFIEVSYPGRDDVRFEPTDGGGVAPRVRIATFGTGAWRCRVIPLEDFDPSRMNGLVTVRGQGREKAKLLLGSLDLFNDRAFTAEGVLRSGSAPGDFVATYQIRHVSWEPARVRPVLLRARDDHGNVCLPYAVLPSTDLRPAMRPVDLF